jgi:hypothetical protein
LLRVCFILVDAQKWSQIQGVITQSEVSRDTRKNEGTGNLDVIFGLRISYEYTVGSEIYTGHNFTYGRRFREYDNSQEAKAESTRYPIGQAVTVYYDPKKPANAALDITVPDKSSVTVAVIIGTLILVVGIVLFFVSRGR